MATFETPALAYKQGERNVYSFVMDLEEVKRFLPMRAADDANQITENNRALIPSHTRNIKRYLTENDDWVLPAITLAATPDNVQFTPNGNTKVGTIKVSNKDDNERNLFRIVDGQHRRHAIQDLMTDYEEKDTERWTTLGTNGLSVTLYSESNSTKIRQMFATMALSKPIDRNTRQQFDSSNPFNNAASYAIANSKMLDGGKRVNTQRPNLQTASEEFLTHNDLKEIAIALTLGLPVKAPTQSQIKHHHAQEQQVKIYETMTLFMDEFLPECHQRLTDLMAGEIVPAHLSIRRSDHWVLDPAFVKLLAGCYQSWTSSDDNVDALATYIHDGMNFDRNPVISKSSVEDLELVQKNGQNAKPIQKTSPVWRDAAVKICHAAREQAS